MEIRLTDPAREEIKRFLHSGKKNVVKKIETLLEEIKHSPFEGTGKPEALKHHLSGMWSRRINKEHRIVYEVIDDVVLIHSVKGHY
ncbi:Txe/YoeB family addiction module toxin [Pedobacter heparinus]|uniref:Txe/YoeB family addiction module toxin n=1 Tax=Pedobacter heparinus TaxID=984 RepID=UPI00292F966A|nr:Txe/YoeB family addiction module toxin [Pedobacter heparinus]